MKFSFLQQCALYVEPENATKTVHGWVTPRYTPVKYLYQTPSGTPPPLGMRSAVPLGGMGTGKAAMRKYKLQITNYLSPVEVGVKTLCMFVFMTVFDCNFTKK